MPRRVLFMISSMRGGGSERQTLLLLRHLDRERFTPHLYVTERVGDLMSQLPTDVKVHSFEDAEVSPGLYFPGRVLRQQIAYLRDLLQRESIDVIYDRTFHMSLIAGPAAAALNVPRVATVVSPPHHALPLVESRFVWLKRRRLATAYRQAKTVVAVSQQAADSAESYYGLGKASVAVVMNPVDADHVRDNATQAPPTRDQCPTFVCVGRMTAEKGHADFINALALTETHWPEHLPPAKIWMIGDGPLRDELEAHCRNIVKRHDVEFLGIHRNPAPAIAAADALVLPSHFEGMPNVVLEAMALATPVIATSAGGTIELQRDEPTVFWAEPRDPNSLAMAIIEFVTNPKLAAQQVESANRLIHHHHDIQSLTQAIEDYLDS